MRIPRPLLVGATASAMSALYGVRVGSQLQLIDHIGFRATVVRMRHGQGYYSAYVEAFQDRFGVAIGEARGVRLPTVFLLWRWIPDDRLYLAYILGVVVLTAMLLAAALPERAFAALVPAAYLLIAGRSLTAPHVDAWLMCELWAVPALAGAVLAWMRGRDRVAVVCVVLAVLTREIAAVALVIGFILARAERRPHRPWALGTAVVGLVWAFHLAAANGSLAADGGGVAAVLGTASFPRTLLEMMAWNAPEPVPLFALTAFAGAAVALRRRPELRIASLTLPIPLLGLITARSYWGMLAVPFAWWLTALAVADAVRRDRPPPGPRTGDDHALGPASADAITRFAQRAIGTILPSRRTAYDHLVERRK